MCAYMYVFECECVRVYVCVSSVGLVCVVSHFNRSAFVCWVAQLGCRRVFTCTCTHDVCVLFLCVLMSVQIRGSCILFFHLCLQLCVCATMPWPQMWAPSHFVSQLQRNLSIPLPPASELPHPSAFDTFVHLALQKAHTPDSSKFEPLTHLPPQFSDLRQTEPPHTHNYAFNSTPLSILHRRSCSHWGSIELNKRHLIKMTRWVWPARTHTHTHTTKRPHPDHSGVCCVDQVISMR